MRQPTFSPQEGAYERMQSVLAAANPEARSLEDPRSGSGGAANCVTPSSSDTKSDAAGTATAPTSAQPVTDQQSEEQNQLEEPSRSYADFLAQVKASTCANVIALR